MMTLSFARLSVLATMVAAQQLIVAQSPMPLAKTGCVESHHRFAPKRPLESAHGVIIDGQAIVQARWTLDEKRIIRVVEYPHSTKDIDDYNSTIIVKQGNAEKRYPLEQIIKGGAVLRLVEVATLCNSVDGGVLLLAFEGGSTGAVEGFVEVTYSPDSIDVRGLPMVSQGKIIVKRDAPSDVQLWSATGSGPGIECDACKKRYTVQSCHLEEHSVECDNHDVREVLMSPNKFMQMRIELR